MYLVELAPAKPEVEIAVDQFLLEMAEGVSSNRGSEDLETEYLRFWELSNYAVVVGRGCRVKQDVHLDRCEQDGVPVIRRFSGGGTVVLGPSCLVYTLVLSLNANPGLRDISFCHQFVAKRLQASCKLLGVDAELQGYSDLCVGGRKFSGNSLKVGKTHVVYHGTLLTGFDLEMIPRYLKMPPRRPAYRNDRDHLDFLVNVPVDANRLQMNIAAEFNATPCAIDIDARCVNRIVMDRYRNPEWNLKIC